MTKSNTKPQTRWKTFVATTLGLATGVALQVELARSTEGTERRLEGLAAERFHTLMNGRATDQKLTMAACASGDEYRLAVEALERHQSRNASYLTFNAPESRVQAVLEAAGMPFETSSFTLSIPTSKDQVSVVLAPQFSDSPRGTALMVVESEEEKARQLEAEAAEAAAADAARAAATEATTADAPAAEQTAAASESKPEQEQEEQIPVFTAINDTARAIVRSHGYQRVIDRIYSSRTRLRNCLRNYAERAQAGAGDLPGAAVACPLSAVEIAGIKRLNVAVQERFAAVLKRSLARKLRLRSQNAIVATWGGETAYTPSGDSYRYWQIGTRKLTLVIPSSLESVEMKLELEFRTAITERQGEVPEAVLVGVTYSVKDTVPGQSFGFQLISQAAMEWSARPREISGGMLTDENGRPQVGLKVSPSGGGYLTIRDLFQDYQMRLERYSQPLNRCTYGVAVESLMPISESEWIQFFGTSEDGYWSEGLQAEYDRAVERYGVVGRQSSCGNKEGSCSSVPTPQERDSGPVVELDLGDEDEFEDELNQD